jgi:hypothetical protein
LYQLDARVTPDAVGLMSATVALRLVLAAPVLMPKFDGARFVVLSTKYTAFWTDPVADMFRRRPETEAPSE